MHISCVESFWNKSEPSGLSSNVVYVWDESVGGSITSDDTVSALSEFLIGYEEPICLQPRVLFDYVV